MAAPHPQAIAEALALGMAWTAKFIADRKVEGVEDHVSDNAERALLKITSAKNAFRAHEWDAVLALAAVKESASA